MRGALLAAVFAAALLPRVAGIVSESVVFDEILSMRTAGLSPARLGRSIEKKQPLYYAILGLWTRAAGPGLGRSRALSAIAGAATVAVLAWAARGFWGARTAWLCAVITGFSVYHLGLSQFARPYVFVGFFSCLSWGFFLRVVFDGDARGRGAWLGLAVFTALGWYSHAHGFLTTASQAAFFIAARLGGAASRRAAGRVWGAWIAAAAAYAPWAPTLLGYHREIIGVADRWGLDAPGPDALLRTVRAFSGSFKLMLPFAAAVAVAFWKSSPARGSAASSSERWKLAAVGAWAFGPPAAAYFLSLFYFPVYHSNYLAGAACGFYLLAARGVDKAGRGLGAVLLVLLAVFGAEAAARFYLKPQRFQWREAAAYLDRSVRPGDALVSAPNFDAECLRYYLAREADFRPAPLDAAELDAAGLAEVFGGRPRVWLVLTGHRRPELAARKLEGVYSASHAERFKGVTVTLFERRNG